MPPVDSPSLVLSHSKSPEERRKENGSERHKREKHADGYVSPVPNQNATQTSCSRTQGLPSTHEDPRSRFFENYRKEAEEYDKGFMKKYDEDLNTTLIFVSSDEVPVGVC